MTRAATLFAVLGCLLAASCAPVIKPMGPPIEAPHIDAAGDRLIAADGGVLPLRSWLPKGAPKAVILGVHGFNDYSNAFAMPGAWWAKQGIATYAYDQRGFGAAPDRGYWPGTATLVSDLRMAARTIKARHPHMPLWLVGDSMGGAVVMVALAEHPMKEVAGAVLVAPAVWGRAFMNPFERGALWLLSHTIPWYPLTGQGLGRTPTDNIPLLIKLSRDPLVIKQTRVDAVKGLVDLMGEALADAPKLDRQPVLMLYGLNDQIVPEDPVLAAMRRMPKDGRNREALYPNGYHFLLRDVHAKHVWRDIATWIENPHAPLPSGADARARAMLSGKGKAAASR